MKIRSIEVRRLELELVHPVSSSTEAYTSRPVVLVSIETDQAIGHGECSALRAPTYTEEYADGAEAVLCNHLVPRLVDEARPVTSLEQALAAMADIRRHHMAKAAVEMAFLDAQLQSDGVSLADFLGPHAGAIDAGATIGLGTRSVMLAEIEHAINEGYTRLKVKIAPGSDIAVLAEIRGRYPAVSLVADANGAYCLDDHEHLATLQSFDEIGLVALEQPLAADDLIGHARLRELIASPILLDESVPGLSALDHAIELGAMDAVSIKAPRLGGVLVAKQALERCRSAAVSCAIGGMFETGLGRASAIALGALGGFDLSGDLGASDRYFDPELCEPHRLVEGKLTVPTGPGLGVDVRRDVVESATVRLAKFKGGS